MNPKKNMFLYAILFFFGLKNIVFGLGWEITEFDKINITDETILKYEKYLEELSSKIENNFLYPDTGINFYPLDNEEFKKFAKYNKSLINEEFLFSPFKIPVEYIFTDGHHSFMLNYYDDNGRLWMSWLGGASHKIGLIPYSYLAEKGKKSGNPKIIFSGIKTLLKIMREIL